MRLRSIETMRVTLPFRFSFGHSLASRSNSQNLIVKATLEDGSVGYGEGVPRDYVTGEDIESAERNLLSSYVPIVNGLDYSDWHKLADSLKQCFQSLGLENQSRGASWCALETALLDVAARSLDKKISDFVVPLRPRVRFGGVVPFGGSKALKAVLTFYKIYGFRTVKVKVGADLDYEVEKLTLARQALGPDVTLRVDANCAWNLDQALSAAERFKPFKVASYEQPLPADDWDGLAKLTASIAEDVLVDESLCTIAQARDIASGRVASAFNIRVSKAGGLLPAAQMADIARQHGLRIHMGAQVGESGILSAAGRIFALSQEPFENYEGSNNFFLLSKDLTRENLNVGFGGFADLSFAGSRNGLGVTVLDRRLLALCDDSQAVVASGQMASTNSH